MARCLFFLAWSSWIILIPDPLDRPYHGREAAEEVDCDADLQPRGGEFSTGPSLKHNMT